MRTNRRQVLAGAGVAMVGAAFIPRDADGAASGGAADVAGTTVILQDHRHTLPAELQRRLAGNGARLIRLEMDPVRQWRGESASLLASRATRLLGVTRWPEFLLVRGLAEESGRRVRYQRLDTARSAIIWLIA